MTFQIGFSRPARGGLLIVLLAITGLATVAKAGLSEADRITLDQPACVQMKAYAQDITLLNDEMQNMKKFGTRRMCVVLERATTTIGTTVGYMQSHVGECTITAASIDNLASLGRSLENDRRKLCR
ncbi:hypothetical protein [Bradyrhizobium sp. dw_411]|uniref:hypothetical protein n=1 Tax=Bradyrhizobium sp. dw_411 TaxID=2720082 RepID=UPI001BCA74F8|nr:hypothetical protein [Bradyrhizobium sp. dw_411]